MLTTIMTKAKSARRLRPFNTLPRLDPKECAEDAEC
jgi:hypothetical protein